MRIALVQMDVQLGEVESNLNAICQHIETTTKAGVRLTIFPECALPGYCFDSLAEARPYAQSIPGPATERIAGSLKTSGSAAIVGMLEADGDHLYNVAVLIGPDGVIGRYRKIHLPGLGIDRFNTHGPEPFAVHEFEGLRVGMAICYDSAFPESMRCLALAGADLVALPTNFPSGAEGMIDFVCRTRAMENNVYFACCNRIGEERGFRFLGGSQIINPTGRRLAMAGESDAEILYADIDPQQARQKQIVRVPGKHVIHRMNDRRPELYSPLTLPVQPSLPDEAR